MCALQYIYVFFVSPLGVELDFPSTVHVFAFLWLTARRCPDVQAARRLFAYAPHRALQLANNHTTASAMSTDALQQYGQPPVANLVSWTATRKQDVDDILSNARIPQNISG